MATAAAGPRALPRELAPGLVWIGNCSGGEGRGLAPSMVHSNNSVYVVSGTERSLLVDTGHPKDWAVVERQLDGLLADGIPPVAYVFPTHVEPVHAGNLGRLLEKFPDAVVCGDVRDYHLIFPQFADRFVAMEAGDELELGERRIELLDAIFHDSLTTRWAYDPVARALFTADGFAYLHFHLKGHCGKSAEEIPDLPVKELTGFYGEFAFYWTRFVDIEPHVVALERLLADRRVDMIAPSHGSPILDPAATFPKIVDGMRFGRQATREEIVAALVEASAA